MSDEIQDENKLGGGRDGALVGLFLHTFRDGKIHYQGRVLRQDDSHCFVQLFSFVDGRATSVIALPYGQAVDPACCSLFNCEREWVWSHLVERQQDGGLVGSAEECLIRHFEGREELLA